MHLLNIARDARAQVDALHRFEAASILVPLGYFLGERRCDRDRRGGRGALGSGRQRGEAKPGNKQGSRSGGKFREAIQRKKAHRTPYFMVLHRPRIAAGIWYKE